MAETDLGPEDELTLDEMVDEGDDIVALKTEIAELKDAYMRALADVENSRKRADRDRREAENYGGSRLARDLLPVYDNLERALKMQKEDPKEGDKALLEGVELTMRELIGSACSRYNRWRYYPSRDHRFHVARSFVAARAGWRFFYSEELTKLRSS